MSEFIPFENKLARLIGAQSPAGRRKLAAEIAKELRRWQQQRIKQQKEPDGTPYQALKHQPLRAKNGRIKRTMFRKLRTSRYMKACGRNDTALVEFTSKVQHIARVHQFGLKDWQMSMRRMCNIQKDFCSVSIKEKVIQFPIYLSMFFAI